MNHRTSGTLTPHILSDCFPACILEVWNARPSKVKSVLNRDSIRDSSTTKHSSNTLPTRLLELNHVRGIFQGKYSVLSRRRRLSRDTIVDLSTCRLWSTPALMLCGKSCGKIEKVAVKRSTLSRRNATTRRGRYRISCISADGEAQPNLASGIAKYRKKWWRTPETLD